MSEFLTEPDRGYGGSIACVFHKLEKMKCSDPYLPAKEQFNGQGSYGNGGAMRIAPAGLFGYNLSEEELNVSSSLNLHVFLVWEIPSLYPYEYY